MPSDNFSSDGMRPPVPDTQIPETQEQRESSEQQTVSGDRKGFRLFATLEHLLSRFYPGERMVLYALTIVLAASAVTLLIGVNRAVSVTVPARGGNLTEG